MNQLFYNIFKPVEHLFLEEFVCRRHERAQWEYEARLRNWILLDKFTSYVIMNIRPGYKLHQEDCRLEVQFFDKYEQEKTLAVLSS